VAGAVAGVVATLPMTGVMWAAQRLGALGRFPPSRIASAGLDAAGAEEAPRGARDAAGALLHLAFGAALGALYAWGTGRLGRSGPVLGAAFGTAVWAGSYGGWIPALGILPPPHRDRSGRPIAMVLAHWVYGAALDAALARA
jgi:hypothetical protein